MKAAVTVFEHQVGMVPHQVTVYERVDKRMVLYLRWRANTAKGRNWVRQSLGKALRDAQGAVLPDVQAWAINQAHKKYAELIERLPAAQRPEQPLTLAEGRARLIDPKRGKYPTDTMHRREVLRQLDAAAAVLGPTRLWQDIGKADLRELWRSRIEQLVQAGHPGLRGAEITITALLSAANWLRDEGAIAAGACVAPRFWKRLLADDWRKMTEARGDYAPARPRHTLEQMRQIIDVAPQVDPRFALLVQLGAEVRLGQVARARRSDLDLVNATFRVPGAGNKRGVEEVLTAGQLAAARAALGEGGYLAALEAEGGDFPLFPSGQLPGGRSGAPRVDPTRHRGAAPVGGTWIRKCWLEAERLAQVPHVAGRGHYGVKRAAVDAAAEAGISREGMMEHGGWADLQMPDRVYRDQTRQKAREEAAAVRAMIRGEK